MPNRPWVPSANPARHREELAASDGGSTISVFKHLGQWWGAINGLNVFVGPCIANAHAKRAIIAAAQTYPDIDARFLERIRTQPQHR